MMEGKRSERSARSERTFSAAFDSDRRSRENTLRRFVGQKAVDVSRTWARAEKKLREEQERRRHLIGRIDCSRFDSNGRRIVELGPALSEADEAERRLGVEVEAL